MISSVSKEKVQKILGREPGDKDQINEIIVKIEMKKFQNLITNRLERKNNLVSTDVNRVFPLNKITDGTARIAQAPTSFQEGLTKLNPRLFNYYEKRNKSLLGHLPEKEPMKTKRNEKEQQDAQ